MNANNFRFVFYHDFNSVMVGFFDNLNRDAGSEATRGA